MSAARKAWLPKYDAYARLVTVRGGERRWQPYIRDGETGEYMDLESHHDTERDALDFGWNAIRNGLTIKAARPMAWGFVAVYTRYRPDVDEYESVRVHALREDGKTFCGRDPRDFAVKEICPHNGPKADCLSCLAVLARSAP